MKPADTGNEKKLAADYSIALVKNGMTVGLGSGTTSALMIARLGEKVAKGLSIQGVASSEQTASLARQVGIPLTTLEKAHRLDITIDGADEFNPDLQLIKGGGGALLREKILAHNSNLNVIIADSGKRVEKLGKFKLPLETIGFATHCIIEELSEMGLKPVLRNLNRSVFRTDEHNFIVDIDIWGVDGLIQLNNHLINIPGVVETGLFLDSTDLVIIGHGDSVEILEKGRNHKP
jgi:ribose 5-phosphate isomerase A